MEPTLLLTSSVVAAVGAALLNGFWNRRAAKKMPKTEMRAEAYRDLVVYMVSARPPSSADPPLVSTTGDQTLVEIKARLLLFGESDVVSAVSSFFTRHAALNNQDAVATFAHVVCEMRKSLLTGYDEHVAESIRVLLHSETAKRVGRSGSGED